MTFCVIEPVGLRADVAGSIRDGDHHRKGEHTLLDESREFAAERVEHVGTPGSFVGCTISGQHVTDEDGIVQSAQVTVSVYVAKEEDVPKEEAAP